MMRWAISLLTVVILCLVAIGVFAAPPLPPPPPTLPGDCVVTNQGVEICDGIDNDCNGAIDDNLTRATTCGVGECTGNTGFEVCENGLWVNDTCDPFNGSVTEDCSDGLDNDCDGFTDANDALCAPPPSNNDDDDGGSSSSSSSRRSSSFYMPSDSDDEEVEENETVEPMSLVLNWTYERSTATAVILEPTSPVKKLTGNAPSGPFLTNSTFVSADSDGLPAPLPEDFTLYHRFKFGGDVAGVVFEEMDVTFTVDADWLAKHNASPDELVVLYPFDGRWRIGTAEYNNGSRLYKASLVNVPLQTLALGVGAYEEETSVQVEQPAVEPVDDPVVPPAKRVIPWSLIISILAVVLIGGAIAAFFLVPALHEFVGGLFSHKSSVGTAASSSPSQPTTADAHMDAFPTLEQPEKPKPATREIDEYQKKYSELLARVDGFIERQRASNVPDEQIIVSLRKAGWKEDLIMQRLNR